MAILGAMIMIMRAERPCIGVCSGVIEIERN